MPKSKDIHNDMKLCPALYTSGTMSDRSDVVRLRKILLARITAVSKQWKSKIIVQDEVASNIRVYSTTDTKTGRHVGYSIICQGASISYKLSLCLDIHGNGLEAETFITTYDFDRGVDSEILPNIYGNATMMNAKDQASVFADNIDAFFHASRYAARAFKQAIEAATSKNLPTRLS